MLNKHDISLLDVIWDLFKPVYVGMKGVNFHLLCALNKGSPWVPFKVHFDEVSQRKHQTGSQEVCIPQPVSHLCTLVVPLMVVYDFDVPCL